MIQHLAALIESFPGAANQTRCFAHILNLVAKSILRQFEGPKNGKVVDDETAAVVGDMDIDNVDNDEADSGSNEGDDECDEGDDDDDDDDEEGLPEEMDVLTVEEMMILKESVKPIRLVLTKVSQQTSTTSTTINNSFTASRSITRYQELIYYCPS
jgi:hypothetical protein